MKQYSFNSVGLIIDLVPVVGFAQTNNIITAARSQDQHVDTMSARGEMSVATLPDKSGIMSFTLLQTSNGNSLLSLRARQMQGFDWAEHKEFIPINALLSERSMSKGTGLALATGLGGYFPRQPVISRGMGIQAMTWTIRFEQLIFNYGLYDHTNILDDIF